MAETVQPLVDCPYCGNKQVRLSARQSKRRPVEIYRCTRCKRHFEKAAAYETKPFPLGVVVIGVLAAITIGTIVTISMGGPAREPTGDIPIPGPIDPKGPAPVAGTDMASQYNRGFHFWTMGKYSEAFPWLKTSAGLGHREARYYLGLAYLYGRGTVQNYLLAFEQIQASARQSYLNAQHQLGVMYRDGVGTQINREQAYIWLNIAASGGHETATHDRDKMAMVMSADEITHAQDGTMKELALLSGVATPAAPATPAVKTKPAP
jgi:DNA-directed RNA polymerase subunit RPC12/RpoP